MLVASRTWWQGYAIAFGSTLIALGLTLLFYPVTQRIPFVFFYAALTVSAGYGGFGPGILTTILAVLLVDYFVSTPLHVISLTPVDLLPFGLFVLTALFISSFQSRRRQAEQTLREQRERYRVTLSSIGDAVIATDTQGTVTFMNGVAEALTGWSQAEAQGKDVRDVFRIVNEETRQPVDNPIFKVLQSGVTVGLANHTALISQRGCEHPIDDSSAPIKDERGKVSGVILIFRDVTERKQAEARFRLLAETSALLSSSLDYETTLKNLECVVLPTFADYYMVDLLNGEDSEQLRRVAVNATNPSVRAALEEVARRFSPDPKSIYIRKALHSGQPYWIADNTPAVLDQAATNAEHTALYRQIGAISSISLPLLVRGNVIGVLSVGMSQSGRHYTDGDVAFGEELARRIAQAIDNARLYQEAQTAERQNAAHAARLSVLADASRAFAETNRDPKLLFDTITERFASLVGEACALRLLTEDGQWMATVAVYHPDPEVCRLVRELTADRRPANLGIFATVIGSGQTIRLPHLTEEQFQNSTPPPLHAYYPVIGAQSTILSPLRVGDKITGILTLSRMTPDQPYTEEDEHLVQDITARAALAIENAQLYQEAQLNADTLQQQVAQRTVELQRALDKAQAADQAKTRMLANVSHEMRTPLSSITGFSNLLLTRAVEVEKQRQFLSAINDEGWRLTNLVDDFLDLQRIESGRQVFRFTALDVGALIQDTLQKQSSLEKTARIRLLLEPTPPVRADSDRIRQVLLNLVSNALKFSEGAVEVSLHQDPSGVQVSVQDHGMGIPPQELDQLFQIFYRGEGAERERIRGTGLGLALCKQIVEAHHGRIWAESAGEGQGATFRFTLPLAM